MLTYLLVDIDYFIGYAWSLVVEGVCPFCMKELQLELGAELYLKGWSSAQCPKCTRVYIEQKRKKDA